LDRTSGVCVSVGIPWAGSISLTPKRIAGEEDTDKGDVWDLRNLGLVPRDTLAVQPGSARPEVPEILFRHKKLKPDKD
jgi:hypothetical protein